MKITEADIKILENFIQPYEKKNFNIEQLKTFMKYGIKKGISKENFKLAVNPQFNKFQIIEIFSGFENRLSYNQVKFYAHPDYMSTLMLKTKILMRDYKIKPEELAILKKYASKKTGNIERFEELKKLFEMGFTPDYIKYIDEISQTSEEIIPNTFNKNSWEKYLKKPFFNYLNNFKNKKEIFNYNAYNLINFDRLIYFYYFYNKNIPAKNVNIFINKKIMHENEIIQNLINFYNNDKKMYELMKKFIKNDSFDTYDLYMVLQFYRETGYEILNAGYKEHNLFTFTKFGKLTNNNLKKTYELINKISIHKSEEEVIKEYILKKYENKLKEIINNPENLDVNVLELLIEGIKNKVPSELLKFLFKKNIDYDNFSIFVKMYKSSNIFEIPEKYLKILIEKDFSPFEITDFISIFKEYSHLSKKIFLSSSEILKKIKINIENIKKGIDEGLSLEEILFIINNVNPEKHFLTAIINLITKLKDIMIYNLEFSPDEAKNSNIKFFKLAIIKNMNIEYIAEKIEDIGKYNKFIQIKQIPKWFVKLAINPSFDYGILKMLIKTYKEHNLNENQVKLMILTNFKISADIIKYIDMKNDEEGRISLILKKDIDDNVLNKLKEKLNVKKIKKKKKEKEFAKFLSE